MTIYFAEWNAEYERLMFDNVQNENKHSLIVLNNLTKHYSRLNQKLINRGISNQWFIQLNRWIKLRHIKEDDFLVCNGYNVASYIDLIKNLNCYKILIFRDSVEISEKSQKQLGKIAHNQSYFKDIFPYFDKIYSYDKSECQQYGFYYLGQFLPYTFEQFKTLRRITKNNPRSPNFRCFFVGQYRKERANILNKIAPILKSAHCSLDFNLDKGKDYPHENNNEHMFFKWNNFSYLENIERVIKSDVIFEINFKEQFGPSLRTIEALLLNKKLVTTNSKIVQYEFHSPEQIFILSDNNHTKLIDFLYQPFQPIPIDNLFAYSFDGIIAEITKIDK